jgi:hypothetical protein
MMLVKIAPGRSIEVFYMNKDNCDNYNQFHGYRETDYNYVREGYYYESMIGSFTSKDAAVEHARNNL